MKLTAKQLIANELLAGAATHNMLFGGSRSGKTWLLVRAVCMRAIKAPKSRHAILRFRFNAVKNSIVLDTFPKVMGMCFTGIKYTINKSDFYAEFENGSQVWFAGLDDKERTEKILGMEFVTIYFNECSQIPYGSIETAITRLAQKATQQAIGNLPETPLLPRVYYDCVSGDTVLDGHTKTVAELAVDGNQILVFTTHGFRIASAPWANGYGDLFRVTTNSGRELIVTKSHRFWTSEGWRRLDSITSGQKILCLDEARFGDAAPSAPSLTKRVLGLAVSCCKYLHQRGERSLRVVDGGLPYPAFASCAAGHTQCLSLRGRSSYRMGHLGILEVQHIRRIREFLEPLLREFSWWRARKIFHDDAQASELFRQKPRSVRKLRAKGVQTESETVLTPHGRVKLTFSLCLDVIFDAAAIGRQWLRYKRMSWQSLGLKALAATNVGADLFAFDAPLIGDGFKYETVDVIEFSTTNTFYTVYVPGCNHYVAAGMVSHNCNPPPKSHWSYRIFKEKRHPETKLPLARPDDYACMQINPVDNTENLTDGYLDTLQSLSARARKRFLDGEFADATPNALFADEDIDKWRVMDGKLPDMVRMVIAVDPSGSGDVDNADNDAIGIIAAGLGTDGNAYLLEDLTVKAGPATWGKIATDAFDRHRADVIVGEVNYGGAMVQFTIQTCRPRTPYKSVTASRGKAVRAEPIAALYEQGKVRHVGMFHELEDELAAFSTAGYLGEQSPNRADALIWALTELFPGIVNPRKPPKPIEKPRQPIASGWMR